MTRFNRTRLLAAPVAFAVAGTVIATLAVDRGHERADDTVEPAIRPVAVQRPLAPTADCDALLAAYVEAALPEVTAWGLGGSAHGYGRDGAMPARALAADQSGGTTDGVGSSRSGTNVQEDGVDEADVAKTDGRHVYRVRRRHLTVHDMTGPRARRIARVALPRGAHSAELLLAADRLVVLSGAPSGVRGGAGRSAVIDSSWPIVAGATRIATYDVGDPAKPALLSDEVVDGTLLGARLHGADRTAAVRLTFRHGPPALRFVHPNRNRTRAEARRRNRALVRASRIEDWLPRVRPADADRPLRDAGAPLVDCTDVALVNRRAATRTVSLVAWDVAAGPADRSATAIATDSETMYASSDRVYVATQRRSGRPTAVHAFALETQGRPSARYLGSGKVPGTVADRWSFDAHEGTLRVASALGKGWNPRENAVTVLAERDGRLVRIGHVAGMGVRERIQSVRWFDDLAVLVTFRQVDPLYTVDLREPTSPRLLGELKIPGFSAYLHPIGDDRVLGLGQDATRRGRTKGAQASLFDLSDLTRPRRVAARGLGRRSNWIAEWEPRSFTWLPEQEVGVAVASYWRRGLHGPRLIVVRPRGDRLVTRMLPRRLGRWSSETVRTLPLTDGRLAVVSDRAVGVLRLTPSDG